MNKQQAAALVEQTFRSEYDEGRFLKFIVELTNQGINRTSRTQMAVPDAFHDHVSSCLRLGTYANDLGELVDILVVKVRSSFTLERTRTALRNFVAHKLKRGEGNDNNYKEAALVAFCAPNEKAWRFSFVRMEYATVRDAQTGKYKTEEQLTPARRFTYLVGPAEQTHTAQSRFIDLLVASGKPTVDDIMAAFSVEKVTNEFFDAYKKLFLQTLDELNRLCTNDAALAAEFARAEIDRADFSKKMLGQIVFLYFLQKKGWLGVAKGAAWGTGPANFMRTLAQRADAEGSSLFNDIFEPLFYDTLAIDRKADNDWAPQLGCRIPFLNGGLFEPYHGYDWRNTEITFANALFTNPQQTGILDVFDRYNFTVDEAEPLETDVAIDPEMLGKVFENLLDVNDRAATGAFYTPREIVHYMCQVSLVHYLERAMTTAGHPVSTADVEALVYRGDQAAEYEKARESGTTSYTAYLPESIRKNAKALDTALEQITVLDPAIGSGAFPVGMMNEIVRLRSVLSAYFSDHRDRTIYDFKRHAIQNSLYGVDLAAGAVEIAKLRLWLSLVVDEDDESRIKPLPNLDFKIVVGNSLLGVEVDMFNYKLFEELAEAKQLYFNETNNKQKQTLKERIDLLFEQLTHGTQTFDFHIFFHEVMFGKARGFDIVIGNPPYVVDNNPVLRNRYKESVYGRPNLYGYFIHQAIETLVAQTGIIAFINPKTLLTDAYFKSLRKYILQNAKIALVVNFVNRKKIFENVLQSTIVNFFVKKTSANHVFVKNIQGRNELEKNVPMQVPIDQFIYGKSADRIFVVSQSLDSYKIIHRLAKLQTVEDCGITFTTGKLQWDKYKSDLTENPSGQAIRLIWAENVQRLFLAGSRLRKDKQFLNKTVHDIETIQHDTIVVQRTNSVEQEFRVICIRISPELFGYPIVSENNTSYIEQNINNIDLNLIIGILSSKLIDFVFRHMNSNTHVSAGELNALPFPNSNPVIEKQIIAITNRIIIAKQSGLNTVMIEAELNDCVYSLYEVTAEEIACIEATRNAMT